MCGREVHTEALILHARLQQLCQVNQQLYASLRTSHATGNNDRVFGGHQDARRFRDRARVTLRRRAQSEPRDPQVLLFDGLFLEFPIGDNQDRLIRRGQCDFVGSDRRLREMAQADGSIVPFGVVAHHGRAVLYAVNPLCVAAPIVHVENIARDNEHGNPIAIGVINRHGSVLQAHGTVHHDHHRPAFDLGVAVRHRR
jgi:hypothetical protein